MRSLTKVICWSAPLAALALVVTPCSLAQGTPAVLEKPFSDSAPYLSRFDALNNVLVFYRDIKDGAVAAARPFAIGVHAGQPIYPLKDFPGALGFDVWGVTGNPGGGAILSGVLQIDGVKTRQLILAYDSSSTLRSVWEVWPYHYHQIASDGLGNLYAFGHREDRGEGANEEDYPLLTKYSANGEVLWQSAPRSWFPYETEVVATNAATGEHHLLVGRSSLKLYVATTRELLEFALDTGRLASRRSLTVVLEDLGSTTHRAEITGLAETADGSFLAQVRLWPKQKNTKPMHKVMARIAGDLATCTPWPTPPGLPQEGIYLGIDNQNRVLFLAGGSQGKPILRTRPL